MKKDIVNVADCATNISDYYFILIQPSCERERKCDGFYFNFINKPNILCLFKCLPFGFRGRGLWILILTDVSPASVAAIFRGLAPVLSLGVYWTFSAYIVVHKCCDVITCVVVGFWLVVVRAMSCGWSAAILPLKVTEFWFFKFSQCKQPYIVNF